MPLLEEFSWGRVFVFFFHFKSCGVKRANSLSLFFQANSFSLFSREKERKRIHLLGPRIGLFDGTPHGLTRGTIDISFFCKESNIAIPQKLLSLKRTSHKLWPKIHLFFQKLQKSNIGHSYALSPVFMIRRHSRRPIFAKSIKSTQFVEYVYGKVFWSWINSQWAPRVAENTIPKERKNSTPVTVFLTLEGSKMTKRGFWGFSLALREM